MRSKQIPLFVLLAYFSFPCQAQDKSTAKFGNVTDKDFANKVYSIDSNASAVILADIGSTRIEGNTKGWFSFVFKHYRRVHILNKNGYDIANVTIPVYISNTSAEEKLDKLKAVTYNLENGKVVETKLDTKTGILDDKISKYRKDRKFTLPNIREGSIIEYEYTVISDFLGQLRPWSFQGGYPRLWSEYNLTLPEFFGYVFLTQGYLNYDIKDRKEDVELFRVVDRGTVERSEYYDLRANVVDFRWVIKNVPPLKEESFTSTINNHITKIEFQFSEYRPPLTRFVESVMGSWDKMAEDLMKSEYFGEMLSRDNGWIDDVTSTLLKGVNDPLEKAKKIFYYIRDHFTCTDHDDYTMNQNLRNVARGRNGNVAEINLLLTAFLKHVNMEADPVILSTRDHGYTLPLYPVRSKFNYVVCKMNLKGQDVYLDASYPQMGFGYLPLDCYNGHARIINKMAAIATSFSSDSVKESSASTVFIINDEKGNWVGSMQKYPGYYESLDIRDAIKEKGQAEILKDIKKNFGTDIEISNPVVDSLEKFEEPLGIKFDFDLKEEKGDIVYINPVFGEGYKENPFKSAIRVYPVEMSHLINDTYTLQMEVPKGYVVDELPKPLRLKMNEQGDAVFEYLISQSGEYISLHAKLAFKKSNFSPEEYETLREFFNMIVDKENEQIVFKKKK
ncbi:MAG TPA: DUF3857 domain-containing protein [Chitinophagaceae bacterium]|nr:DUF3857 domain-containing protein [Chitinophagaceae bacterium]